MSPDGNRARPAPGEEAIEQELVAMREICPACGSNMILSTEAFEINGKVAEGAEHLLCPECGQITFTPDQLDELWVLLNSKKKEGAT